MMFVPVTLPGSLSQKFSIQIRLLKYSRFSFLRVNHSGQSGFSGSLIDQLKAEAKQGLKRAINRKTSGLVRNTLKKLIK